MDHKRKRSPGTKNDEPLRTCAPPVPRWEKGVYFREVHRELFFFIGQSLGLLGIKNWFDNVGNNGSFFLRHVTGISYKLADLQWQKLCKVEPRPQMEELTWVTHPEGHVIQRASNFKKNASFRGVVERCQKKDEWAAFIRSIDFSKCKNWEYETDFKLRMVIRMAPKGMDRDTAISCAKAWRRIMVK